MSALRGLLWGAAAGAAGATALNAVTYLDMVLRARPAGDTPEQTVEALAERVHLPVPGEGDDRRNRIAGLGPLLGLGTGVGVGMLLGLARAVGARPAVPVTALLAAAGATVAGAAPMTALGITDPRRWSSADWMSDAVPHLAYGVVTALVLTRLERD